MTLFVADGLLQEDSGDQDGQNSFDIGSRELLGDGFSPSDPTLNPDNQGEGLIFVTDDGIQQENCSLCRRSIGSRTD